MSLKYVDVVAKNLRDNADLERRAVPGLGSRKYSVANLSGFRTSGHRWRKYGPHIRDFVRLSGFPAAHPASSVSGNPGSLKFWYQTGASALDCPSRCR